MTGPLVNSDGSAEWELSHGHREGKTRLICSVNGPLEAKARDEIPTQATIELMINPAVGLPTIREILLQDQVYTCLDAMILRREYPRSLIQVVVQVLDAGEPIDFTLFELVGAVNVTTRALVNAGVALSGLSVAVALVVIEGQIKINPNPDELAASSSTHAVSYLMSQAIDSGDILVKSRLVLCESAGTFTKNELLNVIKVAEQQCRTDYVALRNTIVHDVEDGFAWKR